MNRNNFIFYKEYKKAIDTIDSKKKKLMFYECITDYVFYHTLPEDTDRDILAMFIVIKDKLDKTNSSYWNFEDRKSSKYKKWKLNVLKRDNYTCKMCGNKTNLVAHHIEPFAKNIQKRYDVENGITLCNKCHKEVHKNE